MVCIIICSADHPFQKTDEIDSPKQFSGTRLLSFYMGKRKAKSSRTFPFLEKALSGFRGWNSHMPTESKPQAEALMSNISPRRKFTRKNKYINYIENIKLWLKWEEGFFYSSDLQIKSRDKRAMWIFGGFLLALTVFACSSFLLCGILTVNNNSEFGGQEAIPSCVCSEIKTLLKLLISG